MDLEEAYVEAMVRDKEGRSLLMQETKEIDAFLAQQAKEKGGGPRSLLEKCFGCRFVPVEDC
jgi:hypothetical protein